MIEGSSRTNLPSRPRAESNTSPLLSDSVGDGLDDLERELGSTLNVSSVGVGSLVGNGLKELVEKVSVGVVCSKRRKRSRKDPVGER